MDSFETKIPASEKDSSMMKRPSFETKSLDEKEKKEKDKRKAPIVFEADQPKPEKSPDLFEKAEDSAPESFQELLGIADKKETIETEDSIKEPSTAEIIDEAQPVGELDEIDKTGVAERHGSNEIVKLEHEKATVEKGSVEEAGVDGQLKFVEKLNEKLPLMPAEAAIDTAAAEVIEEINQASENEESIESLEVEQLEDSELVDTDDDNEEDEPTVAIPTPPVPPPTPIPPNPNANPNPNQPPAPPSNPNTPIPPNGPIPPWANPNIVQPPNNPNVIPTGIDPAERAHSRAGDMLLGGILGYVWGRHRGRIKTEHRLEPIQEKLEQEVTALREKITARETQVRELATSVAEQKQTVRERQEFIQRLKSKKPDTEAKSVSPKATEALEEQIEPLTQQAEKMHAEQLHKRPETIGRMAVILEKPREAIQDTPREAMKAKRVEHLAATELLAIAERIVIEGSNVREMYDAGRLDPEGLRHVVAEYLRGGNVEKIVAHEILAEERQHERAPERQPGTFVKTNQSAATPQQAATTPTPTNDIRQKLAEYSNPENNNFQFAPARLPKQQNSPKALIIIVSFAAVVMVMAAYFISAG